MTSIVLGTAGHVDHGKTTLVKALTGIDTDRLKEEKKRGITIELGFAFLDLPSGSRLAIVDVPGHEKFIRNMLAGVSGIDIVALVIAADEGVMPQTREHLDILQLLGVKKGIIVLSKADLVENEWLELIKEEVREAVGETFLAKAPLLALSSTTGVGLEELKHCLDKMVREIPTRETKGYFRLPIDRVFTMSGFGTVVTGTLISGQINLGEQVDILPVGLTTKIRHLQVHGKKVEQAFAGQRVAVNLTGLQVEQIKRGDVLLKPEIWRPTSYLDVRLHLLKSALKSLKNRERVRFHLGTAEVMGRVLLLEQEELEPGKDCFAQIRLEKQVIASIKDLFVIRSYSPVNTIGGGTILEPYPLQHKRFRENVLEQLSVKEKGSLEELTLHSLQEEKFKFWSKKELAQLLQVKEELLESSLENLSRENKIVFLSGYYLASIFLEKWREELHNLLQKFHQQFPLKAGLSKELIRKKISGKLNLKIYNALLNFFQREGWLSCTGDFCKMAEHTINFSAQQEKIKEKIEHFYLSAGFNPPTKSDVWGNLAKIGQEKEIKQVFEALLDMEILVAIAPELLFHQAILAEGEKIIQEKIDDIFTVAQFRDWVGSSRKYAIPLLEYYDRIGLTIRQEDKRTLKKY